MFGDAVLNAFPPSILVDLVLAKATRKSLGFSQICVIHQMEVEMGGGGVAGMANLCEKLTT